MCDLHRPHGQGPFPIAIVLHGGYWQPPYGKLIMRPLCLDLARRGYAALNVEYRRLGRDGGGWPQTFDDVAAGIDLLAGLGDAALDLERVTLIGHSAGGQLALWAAGRRELPPGAPGADPRVRAGACSRSRRSATSRSPATSPCGSWAACRPRCPSAGRRPTRCGGSRSTSRSRSSTARATAP